MLMAASHQVTWEKVYTNSEGGVIMGGGYFHGIYEYIPDYGTPGIRASIARGMACFDTRAIPVDAVISSVVLKGKLLYYRFYGHASSISSYLKVFRAANPPMDEAGGYESADSFWQYLSGLDILVMTVFVAVAWPPSEIDFQGSLGNVGIASIVKNGYTYFGAKESRDVPTPPTADTCAGGRFTEMSLDITYGTAEDLLVVTLPATEVTKDLLTMNGGITQGAATKRGFDYGESEDALVNEWYEEGTYGIGEFSKALTGLTPGQNFCHRAKAYGE